MPYLIDGEAWCLNCFNPLFQNYFLLFNQTSVAYGNQMNRVSDQCLPTEQNTNAQTISDIDPDHFTLEFPVNTDNVLSVDEPEPTEENAS